MPTWLKVLTVLITLPVWILVVVSTLIRGEIPSPAMMAIPAGVIIATSGTNFIRGTKRLVDAAADKVKSEDGDQQ